MRVCRYKEELCEDKKQRNVFMDSKLDMSVYISVCFNFLFYMENSLRNRRTSGGEAVCQEPEHQHRESFRSL